MGTEWDCKEKREAPEVSTLLPRNQAVQIYILVHPIIKVSHNQVLYFILFFYYYFITLSLLYSIRMQNIWAMSFFKREREEKDRKDMQNMFLVQTY